MQKHNDEVSCAYCEAVFPKDAATCPKCGLANTKGTRICDFCSAEIPLRARTCPKCQKRQVSTIIEKLKAEGVYDEDKHRNSRKTTLSEIAILYLKIFSIVLVITLPFGYFGYSVEIGILGVIIAISSGLIGGAVNRGLGIRRNFSDHPGSAFWASMGGFGLILFFLGMTYFKIFGSHLI